MSISPLEVLNCLDYYVGLQVIKRYEGRSRTLDEEIQSLQQRFRPMAQSYCPGYNPIELLDRAPEIRGYLCRAYQYNQVPYDDALKEKKRLFFSELIQKYQTPQMRIEQLRQKCTALQPKLDLLKEFKQLIARGASREELSGWLSRLSTDRKGHNVFWHIWNAAGRPEECDFGKNHALDEPSRLHYAVQAALCFPDKNIVKYQERIKELEKMPERITLPISPLELRLSLATLPISGERNVYFWVWHLARQQGLPECDGYHYALKDMDLLKRAIDATLGVQFARKAEERTFQKQEEVGYRLFHLCKKIEDAIAMTSEKSPLSPTSSFSVPALQKLITRFLDGTLALDFDRASKEEVFSRLITVCFPSDQRKGEDEDEEVLYAQSIVRCALKCFFHPEIQKMLGTEVD